MDVTWEWVGATEESSGEVDWVLPAPGEGWELTSGYLVSSFGAFWGGWFDRLEVEQITEPGNPDIILGYVSAESLVLGANGEVLAQRSRSLFAACGFGETPESVLCGDTNGSGNVNYDFSPGDPALNGPLTLRYDFDQYRNLLLVPSSEIFGLNHLGNVHLIYSAVPEPGTGLLVMTGLLGLAYRQRRYGRPV